MPTILGGKLPGKIGRRWLLYSSLAQLAERMTVNHDVAGSSPAGGARKKQVERLAFFNEIRLRRVKYGFAMWNSYAVKYLLRKCEEANFISHRTKWDISQFSQENYFTFGNAEYFTKFKSCIFVLWAQKIQVERLGFFYPLRKQWHIINNGKPFLHLISPLGLYLITP